MEVDTTLDFPSEAKEIPIDELFMETCDLDHAEQDRISEMNENVESVENIRLRRSGRKRRLSGTVRPKSVVITQTQTPLLKSAKKLAEFHENKSVEEIYLSKKVERLPPSLETVFEEPLVKKNGEKLYTSARKFRRLINFEDTSATTTEKKIIKRRKKITQMNLRNKMKRVTMKSLRRKLESVVESDSDMTT